jgi:UDP-N-acetylmuramyl pentapeptide phosphotransferase/UDP-N-acetylglucosamine-1-phosphate transferase
VRAAVPLLTGAAAAVTAVGSARALAILAEGRPDAWRRVNHRGDPVTLAAGPGAALGVAVPLAGVALLAVCGALPGATAPAPRLPARVPAAAAALALVTAAVGRYDDTVGARPEQRQVKGLRGHARALRAGVVTAGAGKVLGIGTAAAAGAAAAGVRGGRLVPASLLVAGGANLVNLFDLRPGRALKAVVLPAVALAAAPPPGGQAAALLGAATTGAAAALLPADLGERAMLGDAGANALGAVLGLAVAVTPAPRLRAAALVGVLGLTAASEVVSFSRVIDATPPLAWADRLGRLPTAP